MSSNSNMKLLAGLLASSFTFSTAWAAGSPGTEPGGQADAGRPVSPTMTLALAQASSQKKPAARITAEWQAREGQYYKRNWGVEIVGLKPVSSGNMLAFRYRVLDADKAKLFNDRNAKAYLIDEATGIRLAVPALENIGELRTGTKPQENRTYFMVFGNPGKIVKSGSEVSVVIGNFRLDKILVD